MAFRYGESGCTLRWLYFNIMRSSARTDEKCSFMRDKTIDGRIICDVDGGAGFEEEDAKVARRRGNITSMRELKNL